MATASSRPAWHLYGKGAYYPSAMAAESFAFLQVRSEQVAGAFAFHRAATRENAHLWPKTESDFRRYADQGSLYAVGRSVSDQIVGLCYVTRDAQGMPWELGGLYVAPAYQRFGIGRTLVRFALADTLVFDESEGDDCNTVIAYIHEHNHEPRRLFDELGFEFIGSISVPAGEAPPSMERHFGGNLVGHKFRFSPEGLAQLHKWLREFNSRCIHQD